MNPPVAIIAFLASLIFSIPSTLADDLAKAKAAQDAGRHEEAFALALPLAEGGNVDAQMMVAGMYALGDGVPMDQSQAFQWNLKAAEQGAEMSQLRVGMRYEAGYGVEANHELAEQWFNRFAGSDPSRQTAVAATYLYASHYTGGDRLQKAARWLKLAADQDYAGAQQELGKLYLTGNGVPQDYARAYRLLERAAEQDNLFAHRTLADAYRDGVGIEPDPAKALTHYLVAASAGDAQAQAEAGALLADGTGGPGRTLEAYMWLNLAVSGLEIGTPYRRFAQDVRDRLAVGMTHEEIAEAQARASGFTPSNPSDKP